MTSLVSLERRRQHGERVRPLHVVLRRRRGGNQRQKQKQNRDESTFTSSHQESSSQRRHRRYQFLRKCYVVVAIVVDVSRDALHFKSDWFCYSDLKRARAGERPFALFLLGNKLRCLWRSPGSSAVGRPPSRSLRHTILLSQQSSTFYASQFPAQLLDLHSAVHVHLRRPPVLPLPSAVYCVVVRSSSICSSFVSFESKYWQG